MCQSIRRRQVVAGTDRGCLCKRGGLRQAVLASPPPYVPAWSAMWCGKCLNKHNQKVISVSAVRAGAQLGQNSRNNSHSGANGGTPKAHQHNHLLNTNLPRTHSLLLSSPPPPPPHRDLTAAATSVAATAQSRLLFTQAPVPGVVIRLSQKPVNLHLGRISSLFPGQQQQQTTASSL